MPSPHSWTAMADRPRPDTETTPQCQVGALYPHLDFGCAGCKSPGYTHPALGWLDIPCACPHHDEAAS